MVTGPSAPTGAGRFVSHKAAAMYFPRVLYSTALPTYGRTDFGKDAVQAYLCGLQHPLRVKQHRPKHSKFNRLVMELFSSILFQMPKMEKRDKTIIGET
jgi:hypothetical protein